MQTHVTDGRTAHVGAVRLGSAMFAGDWCEGFGAFAMVYDKIILTCNMYEKYYFKRCKLECLFTYVL